MDRSDWQQARAYVELLRKDGRRDDDIRQILLNTGWSEEQVAGLLSREAPQAPAPPPPATPPAPTRPSPATPSAPAARPDMNRGVLFGIVALVVLVVVILIVRAAVHSPVAGPTERARAGPPGDEAPPHEAFQFEDERSEVPGQPPGTGPPVEAMSAGGRIAFVAIPVAGPRGGRTTLCMIDPDGGNLTRVDLATEHRCLGPMAFSPDGGKVVFGSLVDGNWDLYIMDADGTNPVRLTHNPARDHLPAWSPDGSRIAWVSEQGDTFQIHVMNSDKTGQTQLTHTSRNDRPFWSPDGSKIGFTSYHDGRPEVYVMNADGTNQVRLTDSRGQNYGGDWSPEGGKILFHSTREGRRWEVYVMNADGTNQTRLTEDWGFDHDPVWSPDGEAIAFVSNRHGNWDIYVMTADGAHEVNITNNPKTHDRYPVWLPDQ